MMATSAMVRYTITAMICLLNVMHFIKSLKNNPILVRKRRAGMHQGQASLLINTSVMFGGSRSDLVERPHR